MHDQGYQAAVRQAITQHRAEEMVRLQTERDAARREVERLTHQNQRLIGALRVTATVAILAQCPVCLAERTNGECHDDDCPLVPHQ